MKRVSFFTSIAVSVLLIISFIGKSQSLNSNDLKYYKNQNIVFTEELELYFDDNKHDYNSIERKNALYLVDAITHYPSPHNDCLKDMFLNRYVKTIESIKNTEVDEGVVVWNIYNMSYIVKSPEITIAFDLIRLPTSLRKDSNENIYKNTAKEIIDLCDILFVSHIHGDHADSFVASEFLYQEKPVISHSGVFKGKDFYNRISHLNRNGKLIKYKVSGTEIEIRIYPGHQAISADAAVDNNFSVVTLPNNITVAHSGDQSWGDDFEWLDVMHKDAKIDILMVNTWTANPNRLVIGLNPNIILPGHMNEMNHEISTRIPFWKSYQYWQNIDDRVVHLFWGEPYNFRRN